MPIGVHVGVHVRVPVRAVGMLVVVRDRQCANPGSIADLTVLQVDPHPHLLGPVEQPSAARDDHRAVRATT